MSYCPNPDCQRCQNPNGTTFCQSCGTRLLLGDRYNTIQQITQGSFGRTFLAVDEFKPSKPRCAIKQFLPQAQGTHNAQQAAELFQQEAVRLEELGKHPQIPELLAYFTQDHRQYLVQEFIDGQNLAQELTEEGAFSENQIRQMLNDLLPVLQFIHKEGVIHRDIKPENIIRRSPPYQGGARGGQLVLVDFGAAKFSHPTATQESGTAIGSAEYVAPEQAKGLAVFASDIYSLGVVCIHLLTEISPFDLFDASEDSWVWRHYLTGSISSELSQILDKMLERSTKSRYQSASEVLADLHHKPALVAVKSAPLVTPEYSQDKVYQISTSPTLGVEIPGSVASDLDSIKLISPVPTRASFATERFLIGGFVVTTLLSGSFSPTISVLSIGSLIALILIIFSYRFQSLPEVAKKYELISRLQKCQSEILSKENFIKYLHSRKNKLYDKSKKIIEQQLKCTQQENNDLDKLERELQVIVADINSQISTLNAVENTEILQLNLNNEFIDNQLNQDSITSANIAGIGVEITNRLQEAGVKTAADIDYERVINVYGIGESRASNLISWRKQVEAKIRENLPNCLTNSQEAAIIREKYQNQRQALEVRKTEAEKAAKEKKDAIHRNYQQQRDLLAKRLQDAQERAEAACRKLEDKINKQSENLHESRRMLAGLEQTLDAYTQVNFAAYMKRILFL